MDCPSCGHGVAESAKFCSECGAKLAPARPSQPEGERRQLTAMFCDLVGSTELSARLDPEDYREVVAAYQACAGQVIDRYGGQVGQYLGDGLLVYFGYPRAHEDDAERAVRAGVEVVADVGRLNIDLERDHGVRIAVRVGIHTGPVVVGEMGHGAQRETQALGATLNVAARLEGIAATNTVVMSDATLHLVPGRFLTEDLGTPVLKGVGEPIRVYSVLAPSSVRHRLDVAPSRLTPLVGREEELEVLRERWRHARESRGQGVLIRGEAGVGKSRLPRALREELDQVRHGWLECHSNAYSSGSAFLPLAELLEHAIGVTPADPSETKLTRLEAELEVRGLPLSESVPFLAPLLSLPLPARYPQRRESPQLQRKRLIEVLSDWIFAAAARQPLVLVIEDLHWCDASTLEFVGLLLDRSPRFPVLTILTFRPEFEPPWAGHDHVASLDLGRLTANQATSLIASVTQTTPLPEGIAQRIVDRADGIPLFLEELTQMVVESELAERHDERARPGLEIPTTLQDSLMARIDRLERGKPVAQLGAVVGRRFPHRVLAAAAALPEADLQRGLLELVDAELLFQRGTPPNADYSFKHALVRDVAYESLVRSSRRDLHERVARVLLEHFPARADTEPETVARHLDQAGCTDEAIDYYQRAGERATQRTANAEATMHLSRALELLATLPGSSSRDRREMDLQLALAPALTGLKGHWAMETQRVYERARELAAEIGDREELPRVLAGLAWSHQIRGNLSKATELAHQALAASRQSANQLLQIHAHSILGSVLWFAGELPRSLEHLGQAIRDYDARLHASSAYALAIDRGVYSIAYAAWCRVLLGFPDKSLSMSQDAIMLARTVDHPYSLSIALVFRSIVHRFRVEHEAARDFADQAIELSERLGFPGSAALARTELAWVEAFAGDVEKALADLEGVITTMEQMRFGAGDPNRQALLAEILLLAGRRDGVPQAIKKGFARSNETGQHLWDAELYRHRAGLYTAADPSRAEADLGRAIETAQRQAAKWWELRAATNLARLWQSQGRTTEARALLAPVYGWFTEGFDTKDLKDAKVLLEALE